MQCNDMSMENPIIQHVWVLSFRLRARNAVNWISDCRCSKPNYAIFLFPNHWFYFAFPFDNFPNKILLSLAESQLKKNDGGTVKDDKRQWMWLRDRHQRCLFKQYTLGTIADEHITDFHVVTGLTARVFVKVTAQFAVKESEFNCEWIICFIVNWDASF